MGHLRGTRRFALQTSFVSGSTALLTHGKPRNRICDGHEDDPCIAMAREGIRIGMCASTPTTHIPWPWIIKIRKVRRIIILRVLNDHARKSFVDGTQEDIVSNPSVPLKDVAPC